MKPFPHKSLPAILLAAFLVGHTACRKPVETVPPPAYVQPVMAYADFKDAQVVNMDYTYVDVNADGRADFFFQAIPVGDAISAITRFQFIIYARSHGELLLGGPDDQTPALQPGELVGATCSGYDWATIAASTLTEEVRPGGNGAVYWQGTWKDAARHYLPLRLRKDGQYYYGWMQMSIDKAGRKLVLHKAGTSTEAGKPVKAGS